MNIEDSLEKLGLNKKQIAVYLTLLKLGKSQAGPIVKTTGLHRMQVYEAFDELKKLGLVNFSSQKNVRSYDAADPSLLIEIEQQKLDLAKLATKELLKTYGDTTKLEIRQLSGSEGLFSNLTSFIYACAESKDRTLRMIGGASDNDYYEALGSNYEKYSELIKEYKIKKRLLGPEEQIKTTRAHFAKEPDSEAKVLPKSFSHPVYTRICDKMVSIEFYKPEVTIIQIKSPIVAASYIANFDLIWSSVK
jgi:sugar-specific transcriptional regulator TrmB